MEALVAIIIGFAALVAYAVPVYAENLLNGTGQTGTSLNSTESDVPVLEKISEKGTYLVQLRWAQLTLNPEDEFDFQIFFLNATAEAAANTTTDWPDANTTRAGSNTDLFVTNATESLLPVASYDISIYSSDGRLLWEKKEQPGEGGMPGQIAKLESNYTGPITINISNIRPGWNYTGTQDPTDSVVFSATVVPEFQVFGVLMLAAGVATITVVKLKWKTSDES